MFYYNIHVSSLLSLNVKSIQSYKVHEELFILLSHNVEKLFLTFYYIIVKFLQRIVSISVRIEQVKSHLDAKSKIKLK